MNKNELFGKILRKYLYVTNVLNIPTFTMFELTIYLDILAEEINARNIR